MQVEIDPNLIVFESLSGSGGSRVFYAGALIEGLTLEVRSGSSPDEIGEAQDQAADYVERCLAAMSPPERLCCAKRVMAEVPLSPDGLILRPLSQVCRAR